MLDDSRLRIELTGQPRERREYAAVPPALSTAQPTGPAAAAGKEPGPLKPPST
jgi:hypothetical protein